MTSTNNIIPDQEPEPIIEQPTIQKSKRGRPRRYFTEEDRVKGVREVQKLYRERKKAEKALAPIESINEESETKEPIDIKHVWTQKLDQLLTQLRVHLATTPF